ncbi:MAG: signal peptide peptidase SppA [Candidatus Micrarchaeota archaeon]
MQPEIKRRPARPPGGIIIGTALVLLLIFIVVIALFFLLSSATPALLGKCVAVVDIDTELTVEGASPSLFDGGYPGSEDIAYQIDALDKRDDVGAVVFVFNSPGGSVVATREVYSSVKGLGKPKVSYFREVAASGAYYIAAGTDYIVSDPDALTGSIGVISTVTEMGGLFEKLGVNVSVIKSGAHKDMGSSYRNMTDEERTIMQALVDEIYSEFRGIVVEGRGDRLDMARFEEVTDGRILSGRQAYRAGLVDELGSKRDAIKKAADLAGIPYESEEDIRICQVDTMGSGGGLFGMESLFGRLRAGAGVPTLSFK